VDVGVSWKAAASFPGNCPHRGTDGSPEAQTFGFKIPRGTPSGDALFVWVWLNREHEVYVNCAKVRIASAQEKATSTPQPNGASRLTASSPHSTEARRPPPQSKAENGEPTRPFSTRQDGVCEWESAPVMQTSYFTEGARCMPGAKLSNPNSDDFEYGWDVSCGVFGGDDAYPIRTVGCSIAP
jgi:hypothetical protein